jgi:small subunit ribosomal protein S18
MRKSLCLRSQKKLMFLFPLMDSEKQQKQSKNPSELTFTEAESFARYVTDTGKILPRRITGLSAKHQRDITRQIKRARNMLLMK